MITTYVKNSILGLGFLSLMVGNLDGQSNCVVDRSAPDCIVTQISLLVEEGDQDILKNLPLFALDDCSDIKIAHWETINGDRLPDDISFTPGQYNLYSWVSDASQNFTRCHLTLKIDYISAKNKTSPDSELTEEQPTIAVNGPNIPERAESKILSNSKEKILSNEIKYTGSLGSVSAKWESGREGISAIANNDGDPGRKSYGIYQISQNHRYMRNFIRREGKAYKSYFKDYKAGTAQFDFAWKKVAKKHPKDFKKAQHDFIHRTHYKVFTERLKESLNLDIDQYSDVFKEVIWSTAVQHGPYSKVVEYAFTGLNLQYLDEMSLIKLIYQERSMIVNGKLYYFPRTGANVTKGLKNRFKQEEKHVLSLYAGLNGDR